LSSKIREIQTTFQSGQIDARAIARRDIGLFKQALKTGSNWRMLSSGAIERRPGTEYLADLGTSVRLLPFEFDDDDLYIFAVEPGSISIYDENGVEIAGSPIAVAAITAPVLWEFSWVQSGDFMFIAHKDIVMQEIQRTSSTTFSVNAYTFDIDDLAIRQVPFYKFAANTTTLAVSGAGPNWTLTTSANHWSAAYLTNTVQVKIYGGVTPEWKTYQISGYTSPTVVTATLLDGVAEVVSATKQWLEEAYNPVRGYPQAVAFHAGRFYFGGSTQLPAHIAGSKVGLFWNFDVDDATADDAIFAPIDSDRINSIRHIISGHHLQVFTDFAEMHISEDEGVPITPTTVAIRTNTRFGASYVRPLVFDDATIYVQHQGNIIREYLWNSMSRGYTSNPLSLLANDLVGTVRQSAIDYGGIDGPEQYAYLLNMDGTLVVYHALRSEEVSGFFRWETLGVIESITVVGDSLYAAVKRSVNGVDVYQLEKFSTTVRMDSAVEKTSGTPTATFTGLTEFANETVSVTSENNGYYLGEYTVSATGVLDLSVNGYTATQVWVGYNYEARAETLPINFTLANGPTEQLPKRLVSGFIRVDSSYDFNIENDVFTPRLISDDVSLPPSRFTGVKRDYLFGTAFDRTLTVVSNIPLDCTVLSMGMEVGL